jgi:hypothetical protein
MKTLDGHARPIMMGPIPDPVPEVVFASEAPPLRYRPSRSISLMNSAAKGSPFSRIS